MERSWKELGWREALHCLQREQEEWANDNFGPDGWTASTQLLGVVEELGDFTEASYPWRDGSPKVEKGKLIEEICDTICFLAGYCTKMNWEFGVVVDGAQDWVPENPGHSASLLMAIGGLCRAHVKSTQKIRQSEYHMYKGTSHLRDLMRELLGWATDNEVDLLPELQKIWGRKKLRNWRENPVDGVVDVDGINRPVGAEGGSNGSSEKAVE